MICPKCQGLMRSYERNGVTVDQCSDCRGIYLDRGELEHLIDAESRFNTSAPRPAAPPANPHAYPTAAPAPSRSPMGDLSTIASMATGYLGKGKSKTSGKKGKKSFIDGLFG
ncbi:MAG TPA: zf-TFIIB domain-containing protein [Nakamurella sp.]